ncbi:TRAP transporter large permease subunit, partial [Listeria monocytogenes]|nr:TRAP transporter large permease subunit [Listeria monocytogenes]
IKVKDLMHIFARSANIAAPMVFIVCVANAFGWILTFEGAPDMLIKLFEPVLDKPWVFLLCINIILLMLGCFMEVTSILIIVTPLLVPV